VRKGQQNGTRNEVKSGECLGTRKQRHTKAAAPAKLRHKSCIKRRQGSQETCTGTKFSVSEGVVVRLFLFLLLHARIFNPRNKIVKEVGKKTGAPSYSTARILVWRFRLRTIE
jgi:hypothetical protein